MRSAIIASAVCCGLVLSGCGGSDHVPTDPRFRASLGAAAPNATMVFSGPRANYSIVNAATGYTVADNVGTDGTRTVPASARLRFSDTSIALDLDGVMMSSGSTCSSGKVAPSHVLAAMGVEAGLAACALRASFGWSSTMDDVHAALGSLTKLRERIHARVAA